jgi:hypothetical protein
MDEIDNFFKSAKLSIKNQSEAELWSEKSLQSVMNQVHAISRQSCEEISFGGAFKLAALTFASILLISSLQPYSSLHEVLQDISLLSIKTPYSYLVFK